MKMTKTENEEEDLADEEEDAEEENEEEEYKEGDDEEEEDRGDVNEQDDKEDKEDEELQQRRRRQTRRLRLRKMSRNKMKKRTKTQSEGEAAHDQTEVKISADHKEFDFLQPSRLHHQPHSRCHNIFGSELVFCDDRTAIVCFRFIHDDSETTEDDVDLKVTDGLNSADVVLLIQASLLLLHQSTLIGSY